MDKSSSKEVVKGKKSKKPEMMEVVFCLEENKAVKKEVKLDISDDTHYAVVSGLEEEEEVITGPFRVLSRTLKDGDLVEVEKKEKEDKDAKPKS